MAFNENLANNIRSNASVHIEYTEKKMFGGISFLVQGNMFCGIYKDYLVLRLDPQQAENVLKLEHVKPFNITGRPMLGWVMVSQEGYTQESFLHEWIKKAIDFAIKLPHK